MIMPGMIVGFIFGLLMLFTGHAGAFQVANTQPEKLAAVEGLFQTQARAPALLFGIPDLDNDDVDDAVRIPGLLSLLAGGDPDDVVQGLNDFPRENWPPVYLTFFSFHLMVLLGMLFIAFPFVGLFFAWRKTLFMMRWFLWIAVPMTALPFIANELGWITAEVGRQPWTVYHVLRTSESASLNVPAAQVLSSLIFLAVLYAGLFVVWAMVIGRLISSEANREVAK
jgi:cytochrome d ubiquinol oxidase subunit I